EGGGTRILIDAGLGPRETSERLRSCGVDPASLAGIFLSHEHGDHSRGAVSFSRRWGVRLAGTRGTYAALGLGAEELPGYDVIDPGGRADVGALAVTAVPVAHDAAEPVAFVVALGDEALGHATDLGHVGSGLVEAFRRCQAVLLEANYDPRMLLDGPYPWSLKERILGLRGHLSNADTSRFLEQSLGEACETVVLAHLSQKNNHPEVARMAADRALERAGRDVRLEMTGPEGTGWIRVGSRATGPSAQLRLF
ncbi:MAG TPA: MBL fold metallo-hydrolase, partial [Vicinamibacteria bacterium]